jgi:hypothetical protein
MPWRAASDCAKQASVFGPGAAFLELSTSMSVNRVIVASVLIAAAGLAGCGSTKKALGMTKVTPDEFRVVAKAPLVVPPDYGLRPPSPGEPRPQELQPASAARTALLGAREAQVRSDGEKLLVAKAGAEQRRSGLRCERRHAARPWRRVHAPYRHTLDRSFPPTWRAASSKTLH